MVVPAQAKPHIFMRAQARPCGFKPWEAYRNLRRAFFLRSNIYSMPAENQKSPCCQHPALQKAYLKDACGKRPRFVKRPCFVKPEVSMVSVHAFSRPLAPYSWPRNMVSHWLHILRHPQYRYMLSFALSNIWHCVHAF